MILPDSAADFLARYAADLPAAVAILAALALVLAVVFLTGRRRAEPVVGHYVCHACRGAYAVALVRLPHERLARLACTFPECRTAYGVVPDDGDPVGTLHRAHAAYLRVMTRPIPPRNTGKRKAALAVVSPAEALNPRGMTGTVHVVELPHSPVPVVSPSADWSRMDALPVAPVGALNMPGPVPMPATRTESVETDAPGRNGA